MNTNPERYPKGLLDAINGAVIGKPPIPTPQPPTRKQRREHERAIRKIDKRNEDFIHNLCDALFKQVVIMPDCEQRTHAIKMLSYACHFYGWDVTLKN